MVKWFPDDEDGAAVAICPRGNKSGKGGGGGGHSLDWVCKGVQKLPLLPALHRNVFLSLLDEINATDSSQPFEHE